MLPWPAACRAGLSPRRDLRSAPYPGQVPHRVDVALADGLPVLCLGPGVVPGLRPHPGQVPQRLGAALVSDLPSEGLGSGVVSGLLPLPGEDRAKNLTGPLAPPNGSSCVSDRTCSVPCMGRTGTHAFAPETDAVLETITERRSIRRGFADRDVPDDVVERIVRCGLCGPSSKNAQPWRFHVLRDRAVLGRLADAVQFAANADTYVPVDPATGIPRSDWQSTVSESAGVLRQVPLGIFVENRAEFSRGRAMLAAVGPTKLSKALVGYTFEIIGIGAAVENMWLAAEAFGLRGVYMGDVVIAEQAITETLEIIGDLVGVLALGYSDAEPWIERVFEPDRVVWH